VNAGFAQKHQKDSGIGTNVALLLPYTLMLLTLWTVLLVIWYLLGYRLARPDTKDMA
jgi:aminobenzoyl-glutamate transport protein